VEHRDSPHPENSHDHLRAVPRARGVERTFGRFARADGAEVALGEERFAGFGRLVLERVLEAADAFLCGVSALTEALREDRKSQLVAGSPKSVRTSMRSSVDQS
jgi:hypothetical protein